MSLEPIDHLTYKPPVNLKVNMTSLTLKKNLLWTQTQLHPRILATKITTTTTTTSTTTTATTITTRTLIIVHTHAKTTKINNKAQTKTRNRCLP